MSGGAYKYGDPTSTTRLLGPRPPCWGTSKYDNDDRECKGCSFHHTCREQVLKTRPATAPAAPVSYFNQFAPQQTYAAPAPIAPQVVQVRPAAVAAPVVQQQQMPPQVQDRYGQFQDPMFMTVKSTAGVMRPQLPGENFGQRIAKNMLLASVESALGEVLLGVRQFIWAPGEKDKEPK